MKTCSAGGSYLPLAELEVHGITGDQVRAGRVDDNWREALAGANRQGTDVAGQREIRIGMLDPASQPCIAAASELYCGIVDEVEANDYDVFTRRASVPMRRRLAVAGPAAIKALRARR